MACFLKNFSDFLLTAAPSKYSLCDFKALTHVSSYVSCHVSSFVRKTVFMSFCNCSLSLGRILCYFWVPESEELKSMHTPAFSHRTLANKHKSL